MRVVVVKGDEEEEEETVLSPQNPPKMSKMREYSPLMKRWCQK
jgi:hypothetical protein